MSLKLNRLVNIEIRPSLIRQNKILKGHIKHCINERVVDIINIWIEYNESLIHLIDKTIDDNYYDPKVQTCRDCE